MVVYWKQVSEEISGATMICGVGEVYIFLRVGSTTTLRALTTLAIKYGRAARFCRRAKLPGRAPYCSSNRYSDTE
jgi:hypothetical protein